MNEGKAKPSSAGPVFCGDCRNPDTWERDPSRDVVQEGGKVFEKSYRCRVCRATTFYPESWGGSLGP